MKAQTHSMPVHWHWPLENLLTRLEPERLHAELKTLRDQGGEMVEQFSALGTTQDKAHWQAMIERYLALDRRFETLTSIVQLVQLSRADSVTVREAEQSLQRLGHWLHRKTAPLIDTWRALAGKHRFLVQHSPAQIEWLAALERLDRAVIDDPEYAATQQLLREGWCRALQALDRSQSGDSDAHQLDTLADLLRTRVKSDRLKGAADWPDSLVRWADLNAVEPHSLSELLARKECTEMHWHVRAVQQQAGLTRCTLTQFRTLEQESLAIPPLKVEEAIRLVLSALGDFDPEGATLAQRLVREGRLAVQTDSKDPASEKEPPLCVDTPFGAFVRIGYEPNLIGLMLLMHELGHAIQYEKRRAAGKGHIPLTAVVSEAAALSAECALALSLIRRGEPWATALRRYMTFQTLEMDHRHRMLSRFELGLYHLPELTVDTISQLWLQHNRAFYGPAIQFTEGFETAWSEVHHLFIAPWYLLAYPLAMQSL